MRSSLGERSGVRRNGFDRGLVSLGGVGRTMGNRSRVRWSGVYRGGVSWTGLNWSRVGRSGVGWSRIRGDSLARGRVRILVHRCGLGRSFISRCVVGLVGLDRNVHVSGSGVDRGGFGRRRIRGDSLARGRVRSLVHRCGLG